MCIRDRAGAVGYFVMTKAMVTINPEINMGVLAGIITGLVAGAVYNRWAGIKPVSYTHLRMASSPSWTVK